MTKNKFLNLSGLEYFKDKIISIIEENELVTSTALIDLNEKLDLKLDKSDLPIEKGEGDNSVQLKNTENKANGWGSVALFGYGNTAGASNSFVGGDTNYAYGTGSVVIGGKNNKIEGSGEFSAIVGGDENKVTGDRAFAFGHNVKVYSQYGASFGYDNTVSGLSGFAEGTRNTVSAHGAHAEGAGTTASGEFSHSEGFETIASGAHGHSEGYQTQAIGTDAHAEGHLSISAEHASHAEGTETYAGGWSTHTEGIGTVAYNHNGEHAQGKYNISNTGSIHSIGIGSDNYNRKNAVEIKDDGKHYILGIGGYDGTNIDTATDVASALNQLTEITYSDLYNKVENSQLVPGAKYKIIDYETIVPTTTYWKSANHPFDIIVTAISKNRLDENASCCLSDRDTDGYFANCGIESWKIKYTIYNDTSFNWASSSGKGVIYWMEDNNRNFYPGDFKNIKINPNAGNGSKPQNALTKAQEQGLTTHDIASEYMLSSDGFYYVFSSFDGTIDRSLDRHYIQESGFGILGKCDYQQYLSGCVLLCPAEIEIHNIQIKKGYWSAIILTNNVPGSSGHTFSSETIIDYISSSYLVAAYLDHNSFKYISNSYVYFCKCQLNYGTNLIDSSYFYVGNLFRNNNLQYCYSSCFTTQRFTNCSFKLLQYVKYNGSYDKTNGNATTDLSALNSLHSNQTLFAGTEANYENLSGLVGNGFTENSAYNHLAYYDTGGILKCVREYKVYNINEDNTYILDGTTASDKKISIKGTEISVSTSDHTHTIEIGDGDNKTTDTLESILESFSALIQQNAAGVAANAGNISALETALANHGSGKHITDNAQTFKGAKTFNSSVRIRTPYTLLSTVVDNSSTTISALNTARSTAGLVFTNSSTSTATLAAMGVLSTASSNILSNQTGDTSLGTAFVIDSSFPVLIRALGGLRIANVPGETVSKISFGDSPNTYISYPAPDYLVINSNNVLEISANTIGLNSNNIYLGSDTSSVLTLDTSSLSLTTGKDNLILNAKKAVTIPTQTHITYVKDHGTITSSQTINLEAGCLNKIVINANCSVTLSLTNPNISEFNEYSAHCIISCGTGVTTTNTITLPEMCGTAQTIQYSKTSIIELDIIAYSNSSNGNAINYLTSWQYHRL